MLTVIIAKDREARPFEEDLERKIVAGLRQRGDLRVQIVPHLYDLAPEGPAMRILRQAQGDLIVLAWLYPRAAFWVLDSQGIKGRLGRTSSLPSIDRDETADARPDAPQRTLWCFDLRTHRQPGPYLEEIGLILGTPTAADGAPGQEGTEVADEPVRQRWYPVIDFARCTNCLECLNFCLFGVYGLDESEGITVEQPDACRAGCPACSRVCPEGAIMFPQHADPAIAGDPAAAREGLKLDLSQLFQGATAAELAAAERRQALAERQRQEAKSPADHPPPAQPDALDRLVDEVDKMDL